MKVILCTDITNVGKQGDIKDITAGYARNFLIPKKLVMEATDANLKIWERQKERLAKEREKIIETAKELAQKIEKVSLTIPVKVGDNGKLFGSVTNSSIAKALEDNGFSVEKHDILLAEPLKEAGVFTVDIRLHPEVFAKAKVWVVEEKEEKKAE
jgi:large subunit ribosomal protein L9